LASTTGAAATMAELPQMAVPMPINSPIFSGTPNQRDSTRVSRMMTVIIAAAPTSTCAATPTRK